MASRTSPAAPGSHSGCLLPSGLPSCPVASYLANCPLDWPNSIGSAPGCPGNHSVRPNCPRSVPQVHPSRLERDTETSWYLLPSVDTLCWWDKELQASHVP